MIGATVPPSAKISLVSNATLCALTHDDAEALHLAIFGGEDPDPHGYLFKAGRPDSVEGTQQIVDGLMDGFAAGAAYRPFLLSDNDAGVVGLGWITAGEEQEELPEISFIVGPAHRGKGLASALAEQLAQVALHDGAKGVEAVVNVNNEAVSHILEALGFERASVVNPLTNEVTYRRLAADPS